jgi:hypothetical protein
MDDTANIAKEFHCGTMRFVTTVGRLSASAAYRSSEPPSLASHSSDTKYKMYAMRRSARSSSWHSR